MFYQQMKPIKPTTDIIQMSVQKQVHCQATFAIVYGEVGIEPVENPSRWCHFRLSHASMLPVFLVSSFQLP